MTLSVPERILLLNVLPAAEGSWLYLRSIRKFRESLGFSEAEAAECGLTQKNGQVSWTSNPQKEIEIGPAVADYVSKSIQAASSLKEEYFDLYSRFVE